MLAICNLKPISLSKITRTEFSMITPLHCDPMKGRHQTHGNNSVKP